MSYPVAFVREQRVVAVLRDSKQVAVPMSSVHPVGPKGDPGGNIMAIGLFVDAPSLSVPLGTDAVRTSGYSAIGSGIADYMADLAVDAAYVTANPRTSFISTNSRGFRLAPAQFLTIETFGAVGDWNGTTGTDNYDALVAAASFKPDSTRNFSPVIFLEVAGYYVGQTFENRNVCHFIGQGHGIDSSSVQGERATRLVWPTDTLCVRNHGSNTLGSGTQAGDSAKSAQGATFDRMSIEQVTEGTSATAHGFQMRNAATLKDVAFRNIAGNAIEINATAGSGGSTEGDANNWRVDNCIVHSCGGHGLHVTGNDANAGICNHLITKFVGGCGILDTSGLGSNQYNVPQVSGYGFNGKGRVSSGGRHYALINSTAGIGASTTPGTNNQVWYDVGAGSAYPAWSGAGTYSVELPILIEGASTRSVVLSPYVEGAGPCHFPGNGGAVYLGGQAPWTRYSSGFQKVHNITPALYSYTGVGGYKGYSPDHSTLGSYFEVSVGSNPGDADEGVILNTSIGAEGFYWAWRHDAGDQIYSWLNAKPIWNITGVHTTKTFGRDAPVSHMIEFRDIALGDSNDGNASRIIGYSAAAPTTGYHAQGEIRFNNAPTAGGFVGEVCTASGNPGTWKTFGVISA